MIVNKIDIIKGIITVPGDKSISHRAVMLASIARGTSRIDGFLPGEDCVSTIRCFRQLGIEIEQIGSSVTVHGKGLHGLKKPTDVLDAGNSGTTMRLISGILTGQEFTSTVTGDESLRGRPMKRIIEPLNRMGGRITGSNNGNAPLVIKGTRLKAIEYRLPVASAQVKSAILLAGLYAEGRTKVIENAVSRDHTERMLQYLGADIEIEEKTVAITGSGLEARDIAVPGDISSAAFFMAAAAVKPGSELIIRNVGVNPTRTGIIDVLREMGAEIELSNIKSTCGEPVADILVKGRKLHGVDMDGDIIPRLIDEVPVLAVAAALAEGRTTIRGAGELKFKETDRIAALAVELSKLGVQVKELEDGLEIYGGSSISGGIVESYGDHRIAMAMAICGLFASSPVEIKNSNCIDISFPGFEETLKSVIFK